MAVGKGKGKKGKGGKRKAVDPMLRKEWYDVVAPNADIEMDRRQFTKTLVNKTVGLKRSEDNLKGRIFEANLADLKKDEAFGYRKVQLRVDAVQGRNCLTNFHAMSLTTDRLRSLVKKRCTLISAETLVTTTDGYMIRVFIIGFTAKAENQVKRACYAQTSTVRSIRKRMVDYTKNQLSKLDLQGCVKKFLRESTAQEIPRHVKAFFPVANVFIRKVKLVRAPKFDLPKLIEIHGGEAGIPASREDRGQQVA